MYLRHQKDTSVIFLITGSFDLDRSMGSIFLNSPHFQSFWRGKKCSRQLARIVCIGKVESKWLDSKETVNERVAMMAILFLRGGIASTACSLLLACCCNGVLAGNPWSREVGEARSVQSKTEDIAERLSDDFPFSNATRPALHLDNIARQLESAVKSGCSWNQIQSLLQQTCAAGQQVHLLVLDDCRTRVDRRLTGYFGELNQRIERLDQELLKAYHKQTQPVCVVPARPSIIVPHPSHREEAYRRGDAWNNQREFGPRDYGPRDYGPTNLGPLPSQGLPPGSQMGPIQYRIQLPSRSDAPIARQLLSTVLVEIANRL